MSSLLQVRVPEDVAAKVKELADAERRSVAQWVRLLIEDRLMKEAAAPLFPTESRYRIEEVVESTSLEMRPKAAQKTSVKVPDQPVSVMNRGGEVDPTQEPSLSPVRCHCQRGMIIGAGPRKGECTVCGNPKPLA